MKPISEDVRTFILFFCLGGIAVLSVNTFLMIQNQYKLLDSQERIIQNQEIEFLNTVQDTNNITRNIEEVLMLLSDRTP